ncbi:TPA: hypothetical protein HA265_04760 [Candidatus Woesearchaeota archaeon]|nr:hypothetical protein [Candidatus Woesearchaeota archaeon]
MGSSSFPRYAVFILLAVFFLFLFWLDFQEPYLRWDENAYLSNARSYIKDSPYTEDFRFPLLSFVLGNIWRLTGESLFVAKLLVILLCTGSVYLFYLISRYFFTGIQPFVATILFAFSPLTVDWGNKVYTDFPGLFFVLLSFLIFLRWKTVPGFLLVGVSAGLAFLSRFTYGLWFASLGLLFLWKLFSDKRRVKVLVDGLSVFLGFSLVLLPWLIVNQLRHRSMFWNVVQQFNIVDQYHYSSTVLDGLLGLLSGFNALIILAIIAIPVISYLKKEEFLLPSIFFTFFTLYFLFFVRMKLDRFWIGLLPFVIILALFTVDRYLSSWQRPVSYLLLTLMIASSFLVVDGILAVRDCRSDGSLVRSLDFVGKNTASGDVIVSNFWPYFGYSDNLASRGMSGKPVDSFRIRDHAKYVIYHDGIGEPYDRSALDSWDKAVRVAEFSDRCDGTAYVYGISY